jgi:hypothetical protein
VEDLGSVSGIGRISAPGDRNISFFADYVAENDQMSFLWWVSAEIQHLDMPAC